MKAPAMLPEGLPPELNSGSLDSLEVRLARDDNFKTKGGRMRVSARPPLGTI